ncbi:PepSY domain-containing protein [Francisella philomiragia]|uniref:Peptidase propeptide and YPEB domain protein n=2 Tax=Francisella philomiragia TaxID=28110 RepID=A0AAW3DA99_9GAMM|nr:PepSY domain-containing protein [Francisella philomiragia]AJI47564.1 peptidase propeptide and YPEB domain protein [Francisella philomiragia]AJI49029.1 peptidase propeptide and YPEB domain protein [Francisella philomiragia]KFJ42536.1 peptidase propeptide and YPEB domain protein [Francisella philomiragia]MBK2020360.1 PepSY domain-containing protein [Francisella philomiragia]MBK2030060.1 PepSY domain-containing protein [Francisella philomiragia]
MRKILITSKMILLTVISMSVMYADDTPSSTAVPISKVVANIYSQGYPSINKIEFDDGVYKAKVINDAGKEEYLYIDPNTGKVPLPKNGSKEINMSKAIAAIPNDRCKTITSVEDKSDVYEVECVDSSNKEVKVYIDAISGKISQIEYDD